MKRFNFTQSNKALLGAGLLSMALVGCGSDGEDGKDGVIGVNIDATDTLVAKFTNAEINNGQVTVSFGLENANGVAVLGLNKDHDLRFGIAQLSHIIETTTDGNFAGEFDRGFQWQSYINDIKEPKTDDIPSGDTDIDPKVQFQAELEVAKNCNDCLIDNQDGTYQYRFQNNISNVTTPVKVTYNGDFTQRATLELQLPKAVANANYDWQPSTGKTEDIQTRHVVAIETCYTCHQPESLELHGGRRINLENCASCHTASSGDPESGNSIDFTYMIHAIHKGKERVTVNAEGETVKAPYKVIGYKGSMHNYGNVMYPQNPAADCQACHVEGETAPADAALFKADLSSTACIGCHTEKPSSNHSDTNCVACHNSDNTYSGTGNAEKRHGDVLKGFNIAKEMSVKFTDIAINQDNKLTFNLQVLDGNNTPVDKAFLDTKSRIIMAWDTDKDFPSYTDSPYSKRRISLSDGVYDSANKSFALIASNVTLPAVLNGETLELWSTLNACFNQGGYGVADVQMTSCAEANVRKIEIKEEPYRFVWNNGADDNQTANLRRPIIDNNKCQSCHSQEIYHYDNGVNCQTCHTSDKTTKTDSNYPGGKKPTSFAYKAHLASGHYLKYAGMQSGTVLKTDCSTCHVDTNNEQGIELGRAPERVWRFGDTTNNGADIWVSSDAGSCLSCHQKYISESGKNHIETFGGIINGASEDEARNAVESCATCHTPTQLKTIHKP